MRYFVLVFVTAVSIILIIIIVSHSVFLNESSFKKSVL